MDNSGKLKRFGRYLLLDYLADGGMAKVYRARYLSKDADKIVAIKMIQPHFLKDKSFQKMFLNEIRVTFGLGHPNIAQIYDYGFYNDQLYTAIEFVDGKNLKQFLKGLKKKKYVFPVEIAVYIISQVSQGLFYAHGFRDKLSGEQFNIIHRDISPHNIMLTFEGAVKIIDFGIAKSNTNTEHTDTGMIKGKLSYMAPEYLDGVELDHRYDQFTLGLSLWELLCSRKLFDDKKEMVILKKIQVCDITPPSHFNPNVPEELDRIVMRSLAKDRKNRFENMDQFNRALIKFLYSHYPDFNSSDISSFAQTLFKEDIKRDRAKLFEFGKVDIKPYIKDWESEFHKNDDGELFSQDKSKNGDIRSNVIESPADKINLILERGQSSLEKSNTDLRNLSSRGKILHKKSKKTSSKDSPTRGGRKIVRFLTVALICVFVYFEGETMFEGDIKRYALAVISQFHEATGDGPKRDLASEGQKTDRRMGKLKLKGFKSFHKLFINGRPVEYEFFFVKLPFGKKYRIKVTQEGRRSFIREVTFTEETPEVSYKISELEPIFFGEIYVSRSKSLPPDLTLGFEVEGEKIQKKLPFKSYRLPTGKYRGIIQNPVLGIRKDIRFVVEEDKRTEILIE